MFVRSNFPFQFLLSLLLPFLLYCFVFLIFSFVLYCLLCLVFVVIRTLCSCHYLPVLFLFIVLFLYTNNDLCPRMLAKKLLNQKRNILLECGLVMFARVISPLPISVCFCAPHSGCEETVLSAITTLMFLVTPASKEGAITL